MNKLIHYLLISVLVSVLPGTAGQTSQDGSLRFEVLLNSQMLSPEDANIDFISSLGLTGNRLIALATNDRFYLLGWGGIKPVGRTSANPIDSFAYTPDGLLMIIRDQELGYMDSNGNISKLFALPHKAMGISAGKYVMYVYDRHEGQLVNGLYAVAQGGRYTQLLGMPTPISSLVETDHSILFATRNAIFHYDLKTKELTPRMALPDDEEIISIETDSSNGRIFFSTDRKLFELVDDQAVLLSNKFGGALRYFDKGLIIFNTGKKLLVRIVGLPNTRLTDKP
jgi:hypothetical protein